jgi:hypothetical protein
MGSRGAAQAKQAWRGATQHETLGAMGRGGAWEVRSKGSGAGGPPLVRGTGVLALPKRKWRHRKRKIGRKLLKLPTRKTENGGNETASDMQQKVDSAEADRMR